MTIATTTATRALRSVTVPILGLALLTGCGGSDESAGASAQTSASSSSASSSNAASATSTTAAPAAATGSNLNVVLAAGRTALAAAPSTRILEIEQEAGGTSWEIGVADQSGSKSKLHLSVDGATVTAGPVGDNTSAEDKAKNASRIGADAIGYEKAASDVENLVPGTITEIGLDDHAGSTVWEADVRDSAGVKHSIRLDASNGNVVSNEVDAKK